jgi:putative endonuclease
MRLSYNFYVYIACNRWRTTLYIGVTNDLRRRMWEHGQGEVPGFTKQYNVNQLVYFEHFSDIRFAIAREKQLKKWRREKKVALIEQLNPEWRDLGSELLELDAQRK